MLKIIFIGLGPDSQLIRKRDNREREREREERSLDIFVRIHFVEGSQNHFSQQLTTTTHHSRTPPLQLLPQKGSFHFKGQ